MVKFFKYNVIIVSLFIFIIALFYTNKVVNAQELDIIDIGNGSIVINDSGAFQNEILISNQNSYIITGQTSSNSLSIDVSNDVEITFKDLRIVNNTSNSKLVVITKGYAKVILEGNNEIGNNSQTQMASIFVNEDATIEFSEKSTGSLDVYCAKNNKVNGNAAAAIGANHKSLAGQKNGGNIIINGGTINADAGYGSAGIGGANGTTVKSIVINGGTISAFGGIQASGIGKGKNNNAFSNLIITGGTFLNETTANPIYPLSTPNTSFNYNNLTLQDIKTSYMYSVDNGSTWNQIASNSIEYTLDELKTINEIWIYEKGISNITSDSNIQKIIIAKKETANKPTLVSVEDTSIIVNTDKNTFYSISKTGENNFNNWQNTGIFNNLVPNTSYDIVARINGDSTAIKGDISETLTVTTKEKSIIPDDTPDNTPNYIPDATPINNANNTNDNNIGRVGRSSVYPDYR